MSTPNLLARMIAAKERKVLDLYDVKITVDGSETPDVTAVAEQLRGMVADAVPEPMPRVGGPRGNRRQRRAAASRQRRRA